MEQNNSVWHFKDKPLGMYKHTSMIRSGRSSWSDRSKSPLSWRLRGNTNWGWSIIMMALGLFCGWVQLKIKLWVKGDLRGLTTLNEYCQQLSIWPWLMQYVDEASSPFCQFSKSFNFSKTLFVTLFESRAIIKNVVQNSVY